MDFCEKCDNMYYISINEESVVEKTSSASLPDRVYAPGNRLVYYCRNCGYEDKKRSLAGGCILETSFSMENQKIRHMVNAYTKYDVTLPRLSHHHLLCPNGACVTNDSSAQKVPEIISIRYDKQKLKYLYICADCDALWKNK